MPHFNSPGYVATRCAMAHFTAANPQLETAFRFMDEGESLSYAEIGAFKAVALIPWDHALMTFPGERFNDVVICQLYICYCLYHQI